MTRDGRISRCSVVLILAGGLMFGSAFQGFAAPAPAAYSAQVQAPADPLGRQIRHEILMMPWYSVFDDVRYTVEGGKVILSGQTIRPTLKSEVEARVRRLEGVSDVVNEVEVLPVSPHDDGLRLALYRAMFSPFGLDLYARGSVPSIHLLVKNGHVRLTGLVSRTMDKTLAEVIARSVPFAFSVTNELAVTP